MNAQRVRVFSRKDHTHRDLGPAGNGDETCAPFWSSSSRLWVEQAISEARINWIEIDTESGQRTGATRSVPVSHNECRHPVDITTDQAASSSLFAISEEASELHRIVASLER